MFNFARKIVRHKIGVVAVIAFAVVVFSGDGEEQKKPSSPWASQPAQAAAPARADDSFIGSAIDSAKTAANDLIKDQVGIDAEETVNSWNTTADAYEKANKGN